MFPKKNIVSASDQLGQGFKSRGPPVKLFLPVLMEDGSEDTKDDVLWRDVTSINC